VIEFDRCPVCDQVLPDRATTPLTPRQHQVLVYLREYARDHAGVMPTNQDIAGHLGVSSSATVYGLLKELERKGRIRCHTGAVRGIELLERPAA